MMAQSIGLVQIAPAFIDPVALAAGVDVGVASSVISYVCDRLAMARITRTTCALMVSLLPATATGIGVVVLAQLPTALEVLGVALVIAGAALDRPARPGRSVEEREPNTPSPAQT
jgi:inner membrane transporter RhtA